MAIAIRKGTQADTEAFICLLEEVRAGMPHPEWFYLDPPEFVREKMSDGTMQLWVAMDGDRLAAAFDILIPGLTAENYGYDLGFSRELLLRVINMDSAAVHPDYRGLGLQRALMETVERELRGAGERILLGTVHPENRYSLENVLKRGFSIVRRLEKYGSERYLLRKDIF